MATPEFAVKVVGLSNLHLDARLLLKGELSLFTVYPVQAVHLTNDTIQDRRQIRSLVDRFVLAE